MAYHGSVVVLVIFVAIEVMDLIRFFEFGAVGGLTVDVAVVVETPGLELAETERSKPAEGQVWIFLWGPMGLLENSLNGTCIESGRTLELSLQLRERLRFRTPRIVAIDVERGWVSTFDKRLYSVPWKWTGKNVWIRATPSTVVVLGGDDRIATHSRNGKGRRCTLEAHLPKHRRDRRHRSRSYWKERAALIGPETKKLTIEVFESDDVLSQLRKVQSIVTHLEGFPTERAEATCRRARFYGTYNYRGIKSILAKALDLEPLPQVMVSPSGFKKPPRFVRSINELMSAKLEVRNEPN